MISIELLPPGKGSAFQLQLQQKQPSFPGLPPSHPSQPHSTVDHSLGSTIPQQLLLEQQQRAAEVTWARAKGGRDRGQQWDSVSCCSSYTKTQCISPATELSENNCLHQILKETPPLTKMKMRYLSCKQN